MITTKVKYCKDYFNEISLLHITSSRLLVNCGSYVKGQRLRLVNREYIWGLNTKINSFNKVLKQCGCEERI